MLNGLRPLVFITLPSLLLAACGSGEKDAELVAGGADPALSEALADQIMVDPDLASQNEQASGGRMAGGGTALPAEINTPEEISAARQQALKMVGGTGRMLVAPVAELIEGEVPQAAALTAAARAAASPAGKGNCAEIAGYTMAWAAKMPASFPVYPRANVQEAAGTDEGGCALRVVNFTTPVAIEDVLGFYYTRARSAGFKVDRYRQGAEDMLGGVKGKASFLVHARRIETGHTEVDLVTGG